MAIDDSSIDIVEEVVHTNSVSTYMFTPPFHLTCTRIKPLLTPGHCSERQCKIHVKHPSADCSSVFSGWGGWSWEVTPELRAKPRCEIGNIRLTRQGQSPQNLKYVDCNTCILKTLYTCIECFHSRGQHLCQFIRTKESVCIRKEYTLRRMPGRRLEPHSSHDLVFKIWRNN